MTKVIFRKFTDGDIIALFPEIAADMNAVNCLSYMHVGQHGASSLYPDNTVPATITEMGKLFSELVSIGYDDLKIVKKATQKDFEKRNRSINHV